MAKSKLTLLVRWPIGKRLEAGRVGNVPLALAMLSQHYAEPLDAIRERLDRGEQLKTPAYEYRMLEVHQG